MPKANIRIDTNLEEGIKTLNRMEAELPDNLSKVSEKIARTWISEAIRIMQRNGSVVTGTGIRSFQTISTGRFGTGVLGAQYLEELDTGTVAHWPDTDNYRFISAARSYGMTRPQLAATIAQKGTRPHPWIDESVAKINRKSGKMLGVAIQRTIDQAARS